MFILLADILYGYEFHQDEKDFIKLFDYLFQWKIERITTKIFQDDSYSCGLIAFIFAILLSLRVDLNTFGN